MSDKLSAARIVDGLVKMTQILPQREHLKVHRGTYHQGASAVKLESRLRKSSTAREETS